MKLYLKLLILCTALFSAVLQAQLNLDTSDIFEQAQHIVNDANSALSTVDVSSYQPTKTQLDEASQLIDRATERMNDEAVQYEAKKLVSKAENFAGQYTVDEKSSIDEVSKNGISLDSLIAKYRNPFKEKQSPTIGKKLPTLMVFISSSIPASTIYPLAKQVQKSGGVFVMNGIIDGKLSNTILYFKDLLEKTGVQIQINPTLFKLFNVTTVPQTIVVDKPITPCTPDEPNCNVHIPPYDRMAGNVSLYYALEQFSWDGDVKERSLSHLNQLRSGEWNEINGQ